MSLSPTAALANFVHQSQPSALPAKVVHEAKRAILNWLGCAIGASR
ncbi:MAG: MmgE/PrpD family protein, partial [Burkholderiaceae bacterium]